MGIPKLIRTETASNDASLSFVDGASSVVLDSTYDEYMFVFTDIGPATDDVTFQFQVNATDDAGGGYDTSLITSSYFRAIHTEDDTTTALLAYDTGSDLSQAASFQFLGSGIGNGSDESLAGIMHLFNPSSTTYVKHFYGTTSFYGQQNAEYNNYIAGYINDTTAIDEIQFKMSSGNFDGVIQLYGIS